MFDNWNNLIADTHNARNENELQEADLKEWDKIVEPIRAYMKKQSYKRYMRQQMNKSIFKTE